LSMVDASLISLNFCMLRSTFLPLKLSCPLGWSTLPLTRPFKTNLPFIPWTKSSRNRVSPLNATSKSGFSTSLTSTGSNTRAEPEISSSELPLRIFPCSRENRPSENRIFTSALPNLMFSKPRFSPFNRASKNGSLNVPETSPFIFTLPNAPFIPKLVMTSVRSGVSSLK